MRYFGGEIVGGGGRVGTRGHGGGGGGGGLATRNLADVRQTRSRSRFARREMTALSGRASARSLRGWNGGILRIKKRRKRKRKERKKRKVRKKKKNPEPERGRGELE